MFTSGLIDQLYQNMKTNTFVLINILHVYKCLIRRSSMNQNMKMTLPIYAKTLM